MTAALLARQHDPIVAIATGPGRGAVGIVRVSGGRMPGGVPALAQALCGRALLPRHATYGPFLDAHGQAIDHGLALYFPAPHSFTGEDVLELQAHGGPVVLQLLLARCLQAAAEPVAGAADAQTSVRLPHLRLATPGEFTERAFLHDKLDLAQAEAVADLIDASTEAAARSAARSMAGALSHAVQALAQRMVDLRMLVEATLDFPEEEIDFLQQAGAQARLAELVAQLEALRAQVRQGALLRDGLRVVLAGQPNVGKSSLLNALAGAELAIVTPIAGTTRDRLSQTIQIDGVPLHLTDTAGLRLDTQAADMVERIGIDRSWQAIGEADVVLFLHDLLRCGQAEHDAADAAIAARLPAGMLPLHVYNKADALPPPALQNPAVDAAAALPEGAVVLSALTGAGLPALRRALLERAGWQAAPEGLYTARARHVQALAQCAEQLLAAQLHAAQGDQALELYAEALRLAHESLCSITGAFTPDALLGEIFGRFCIGK